MLKAPSRTNWEFEGFTVMTEQRLLIAGGTPVPLTSKAFDTLVVLIDNRDRVVTKDELLSAVWPDVEVEEGNLTQQIFLLRKALGETAQQPHHIVTIPGHGYRFTAPVKEVSGPAPVPAPVRRGRRPWVIGAALLVFVVGVLLVMTLGSKRIAVKSSSPAIDLTTARITKVTENGRAANAAMSSDGRFVAYAENEDVDSAVSFSPDGRQVVFMRGGAGGESHIVVAEAGGGSQRILSTLKAPLSFLFVAPDWSPDGKTVAAAANDQSKGWRSSIILLPVDGGDSRELYVTDSRIGRVRWLPDGSGLLTLVSEVMTRQFASWQIASFVHLSGGSIWRIAYPGGRAERLTSDLTDNDLCCLDIGANGTAIVSVINSLVSDLWIASADKLDAPRQVTRGNPVFGRHGWLADSDTVVYRDLNGHLNAVHKDGRAFLLTLPEERKAAGGIAVCDNGRYVVFPAVPGNNIWRVATNGGGAVKLTESAIDSNPTCSRDGKSVVYSSMKSGVPALWQISIEGGEPTRIVEAWDGLPSPSGRLIYYTAFEWEEHPVRTRFLRWIIISSTDRKRVSGFTAPVPATAGILPVWSPDESGIDYVVTQNGVSNIWRQPIDGGPPVQITRFNSGQIFSFAWSPDGRWLSLGSGSNRSDVVVMSSQP